MVVFIFAPLFLIIILVSVKYIDLLIKQSSVMRRVRVCVA